MSSIHPHLLGGARCPEGLRHGAEEERVHDVGRCQRYFRSL